MNSRNQKGMSLIETMVSVGILSITVLAFATLTTNQQKNNKALTEKMAVLDLSNVLIQISANPGACRQMLTSPAPMVFNANQIGGANPPTIPLNRIYSAVMPPGGAQGAPAAEVGKPASLLSGGAIIQSMMIDGITGTGDSYTGKLTVNFDPASLTQSLKPIRIGVAFFTDPTSPAGAKRIVGCAGGGGPGELIWSGNLGGGGGRQYGIQNLNPGFKFTDYTWILIMGRSLVSAVDLQIGTHGKAFSLIPVSLFTSRTNYLFDVQTFSGDDSGSIGVQYMSDTQFRWGTFRAGRLGWIYGYK